MKNARKKHPHKTGREKKTHRTGEIVENCISHKGLINICAMNSYTSIST